MSLTFRGNRLSNPTRGLEQSRLEDMAAAIVETRGVLVDNPCSDTFLGRKTQEPFPKEKENPGRRKIWLSLTLTSFRLVRDGAMEDIQQRRGIQERGPRCPTCAAFPRLTILMLDPRTSRTVRLFNCDKCGERNWDD